MAGKKVSNSLVALSSAAILAVYAAGYHRTGDAAERLETHSGRHRDVVLNAPITLPRPAVTAKEETPQKPSASPVETAKTIPHPTLSAPAEKATPSPKQTEEPVAPSEVPAKAEIVSEPPAGISEQAVMPAVKSKFKDGTYSAWGSCRHGDIEVGVIIESGKIVSADITQCLTRYSCSWIESLPGQVLERQNPNVDSVSGATQSADAYFDAVSTALTKATE